MPSDLNMSYGKIFDFVSFLLLGFTLVIKLRNFNFKEMMFGLIMPCQTMSELFQASLFE